METDAQDRRGWEEGLMGDGGCFLVEVTYELGS